MYAGQNCQSATSDRTGVRKAWPDDHDQKNRSVLEPDHDHRTGRQRTRPIQPDFERPVPGDHGSIRWRAMVHHQPILNESKKRKDIKSMSPDSGRPWLIKNRMTCLIRRPTLRPQQFYCGGFQSVLKNQHRKKWSQFGGIPVE